MPIIGLFCMPTLKHRILRYWTAGNKLAGLILVCIIGKKVFTRISWRYLFHIITSRRVLKFVERANSHREDEGKIQDGLGWKCRVFYLLPSCQSATVPQHFSGHKINGDFTGSDSKEHLRLWNFCHPICETPADWGCDQSRQYSCGRTHYGTPRFPHSLPSVIFTRDFERNLTQYK